MTSTQLFFFLVGVYALMLAVPKDRSTYKAIVYWVALLAVFAKIIFTGKGQK